MAFLGKWPAADVVLLGNDEFSLMKRTGIRNLETRLRDYRQNLVDGKCHVRRFRALVA
jgi:hypothetical protein